MDREIRLWLTILLGLAVVFGIYLLCSLFLSAQLYDIPVAEMFGRENLYAALPFHLGVVAIGVIAGVVFWRADKK